MNIWLSSISHLPFPPFVNLDFSCIPAHSKINCGILMSLKASHYTTYSCTMLVQIVEPANRIQHCIISTSQGMYFKIEMNQKTKQSTFFFRDLRLAVQNWKRRRRHWLPKKWDEPIVKWSSWGFVFQIVPLVKAEIPMKIWFHKMSTMIDSIVWKLKCWVVVKITIEFFSYFLLLFQNWLYFSSKQSLALNKKEVLSQTRISKRVAVLVLFCSKVLMSSTFLAHV